MTPCCVPIENGKWHVVRGACGQIFLTLSFILCHLSFLVQRKG